MKFLTGPQAFLVAVAIGVVTNSPLLVIAFVVVDVWLYERRSPR